MNGFVNPDQAGFLHSVELVTMVVLGGLGSVVGSIVGAAVLVMLPQLLTVFQEYEHLLLGLIIIVSMIFMRDGIVPMAVEARWREGARMTTAARSATSASPSAASRPSTTSASPSSPGRSSRSSARTAPARRRCSTSISGIYEAQHGQRRTRRRRTSPAMRRMRWPRAGCRARSRTCRSSSA